MTRISMTAASLVALAGAGFVDAQVQHGRVDATVTEVSTDVFGLTGLSINPASGLDVGVLFSDTPASLDNIFSGVITINTAGSTSVDANTGLPTDGTNALSVSGGVLVVSTAENFGDATGPLDDASFLAVADSFSGSDFWFTQGFTPGGGDATDDDDEFGFVDLNFAYFPYADGWIAGALTPSDQMTNGPLVAPGVAVASGQPGSLAPSLTFVSEADYATADPTVPSIVDIPDTLPATLGLGIPGDVPELEGRYLLNLPQLRSVQRQGLLFGTNWSGESNTFYPQYFTNTDLQAVQAFTGLAGFTADQSIVMFIHDTDDNGGTDENDAASFVYIPYGTTFTDSEDVTALLPMALVTGGEVIETGQGAALDATITEPDGGEFTLSVPGFTPDNSTLLVVAAAGSSASADNQVTSQPNAAGDGWDIILRDLAGLGISGVGGDDRAFSFVIIPDNATINKASVSSGNGPAGVAPGPMIPASITDFLDTTHTALIQDTGAGLERTAGSGLIDAFPGFDLTGDLVLGFGVEDVDGAGFTQAFTNRPILSQQSDVSIVQPYSVAELGFGTFETPFDPELLEAPSQTPPVDAPDTYLSEGLLTNFSATLPDGGGGFADGAYLEITGMPGASLDGHVVLGIDGDGGATGLIDNLVELDGVTIGTNGTVILGTQGFFDTYGANLPTDAEATRVVLTPDTEFDGSSGDIESASTLVILAKNVDTSVIFGGNDLDTDGDDLFDDGVVAALGDVLTAVQIVDSGTDGVDISGLDNSFSLTDINSTVFNEAGETGGDFFGDEPSGWYIDPGFNAFFLEYENNTDINLPQYQILNDVGAIINNGLTTLVNIPDGTLTSPGVTNTAIFDSFLDVNFGVGGTIVGAAPLAYHMTSFDFDISSRALNSGSASVTADLGIATFPQGLFEQQALAQSNGISSAFVDPAFANNEGVIFFTPYENDGTIAVVDRVDDSIADERDDTFVFAGVDADSPNVTAINGGDPIFSPSFAEFFGSWVALPYETAGLTAGQVNADASVDSSTTYGETTVPDFCIVEREVTVSFPAADGMGPVTDVTYRAYNLSIPGVDLNTDGVVLLQALGTVNPVLDGDDIEAIPDAVYLVASPAEDGSLNIIPINTLTPLNPNSVGIPGYVVEGTDTEVDPSVPTDFMFAFVPNNGLPGPGASTFTVDQNDDGSFDATDLNAIIAGINSNGGEPFDTALPAATNDFFDALKVLEIAEGTTN